MASLEFVEVTRALIGLRESARYGGTLSTPLQRGLHSKASHLLSKATQEGIWLANALAQLLARSVSSDPLALKKNFHAKLFQAHNHRHI